MRTWGQGKHGFAAHRRGARSQRCCGESPRALGQKVPPGDRKDQFQTLVGDALRRAAVSDLGPVASAQPCREQPPQAANRTGLILSSPPIRRPCFCRTFPHFHFHAACSLPFRFLLSSGGRGSTASQRTYRELAPMKLRGKSPCLGAESATGRPQGPVSDTRW